MASKVKVNTVETESGSTLTLGKSGDTVTLASGASQSGFGRTGTVDWDTTAKTASFTAVSGNGYFVNTTSGAITMTLPASPSAGDIVAVADYANTFATNSLTVARNGSPINGGAFNFRSSTSGISLTFVYVDGTRGWKNVNDGTTNATGQSDYIIASGGTETTCGDFKIHTFTGPGTFCVSQSGTPAGNDVFEYMVVAGGGSGSTSYGGGGAGGFRFASPSLAPVTYPGKPIVAPAGLTLPATGYPITVGAGATSNPSSPGERGSNSVFSTITSTGGGGGNNSGGPEARTPGGSGGGGGATGSPSTKGSGNTPPVSPPQGKDGGEGLNVPGVCNTGGGGGGAIVAGTAGATPYLGGPGGDGAGIPTAFGSNGVPCGSFRYYAGGGGSASPGGNTSKGKGGKGGGGNGKNPADTPVSTAGTANSGGGGGGGNSVSPPSPTSPLGAAGGSGIVIIRYKFQN